MPIAKHTFFPSVGQFVGTPKALAFFFLKQYCALNISNFGFLLPTYPSNNYWQRDVRTDGHDLIDTESYADDEHTFCHAVHISDSKTKWTVLAYV